MTNRQLLDLIFDYFFGSLSAESSIVLSQVLKSNTFNGRWLSRHDDLNRGISYYSAQNFVHYNL